MDFDPYDPTTWTVEDLAQAHGNSGHDDDTARVLAEAEYVAMHPNEA
jgi:hypothetical protein